MQLIVVDNLVVVNALLLIGSSHCWPTGNAGFVASFSSGTVVWPLHLCLCVDTSGDEKFSTRVYLVLQLYLGKKELKKWHNCMASMLENLSFPLVSPLPLSCWLAFFGGWFMLCRHSFSSFSLLL